MTPLRARIVATLSGFAVMSLELAAVRLLAPHFGDSAFVWTNVIGVMLVALALGAWLGGRLADRVHGARRLSALLLTAGLFAVAIPLLSGAVGRWLLPDGLALEVAMPALIRGSLAATLILFAPPVLVAGAVTPMLVTLLATEQRWVGRSSGLVATWATLGSLGGTFLTTHLLVPGIGSRATVWACAALLITCALVCRYRAATAAALLVPLAAGLVPLGAMSPPAAGRELVAEVESAYQFLQVVREPATADRPGTTLLRINEGLDSFHSVKLEDTPYTGRRYYDYHAVTPFLAGDGARPRFLRVLSLGAAAGSFERIFAAAHDAADVDSVELDPAVVEFGRRHFGAFANPGRVFSGLDARVFVDHARERYHVVLVDAYERQIYIPAHVASRQFFESVRRVLEPGGVVSVNVGGRTFDDPVVGAVGATMAAVFGDTWAFRVPRSRNFMLVARRGAPIDIDALARVDTLDDADTELLEILSEAAQRGRWRRIEPAAAAVLEDDRPVLDALQEQALASDGATAEPIPTAGSEDPASVAQACFTLAQTGDWEGLLAAVRRAAAATPYLRYLAGDARWNLHDVRGARVEYAAARALGPEPDLAPIVEARLAEAKREIERVDRAAAVALRNGWLAVAAAVLLAAAFLAAARAIRGFAGSGPPSARTPGASD